MKLYYIVFVVIFVYCSPLWSAIDKTSLPTSPLLKGEKIIHITSMLNEFDCLSQDEEVVHNCEYLILSFLYEIQQFAILEHGGHGGIYELWSNGILDSYYTAHSVEISPDTYVIQVSPADEKRINFQSFCCNLYVEPDLMSLLGGNPAVLFVSDFLKKYRTDYVSSYTIPQAQVDSITAARNESEKRDNFVNFLDDCIKHLKKTAKDEEEIINENVLSFFIEIVMIDESYCLVRPKRPECLNFQEFSFLVNIEFAYLLHSYGLWIEPQQTKNTR